jgi:pimeloyl-ACP methyl ester carboxylesterase
MESREVEVNGRSVRYRVGGAGRPLVLIHGLAGSWRWWSRVVPRLTGRRRLYLVDLPRMSRARPQELIRWFEGWIDAVALERADVAGHSLGGLLAAEVAASRPAWTRRLVLVAPAGIPCGRSVRARIVPLATELLEIRRDLPTVVADAVRARPLPLARGIAYTSRADVRGLLPNVRMPTLLVWGERDRLLPIEIGQEWLLRLPDARLAQLACAHVPLLEAPGDLAGIMLSFLDEKLPNDARD